MSPIPAAPPLLVDAARRGACIALPLGLLVGCAIQRPVRPLPRGQSVQLVLLQAPAERPTAIRNLALPDAVSAGGGSGAVAGGLWGLSCGFLAFLCVPGGMLIGGLAGMSGGAAVGLSGALSEAEAAPLRERLALKLRSHDLMAELREQLVRRIGHFWDLAGEKPGYQLTIELKDVELSSDRNRQIGLVVQALTRLRPSDPAVSVTLAEKTYRFAPAPSPLGAWLDEGSDLIDTLLSGCSQQFAVQIVADYARD